jgi:hypothetical protein
MRAVYPLADAHGSVMSGLHRTANDLGAEANFCNLILRLPCEGRLGKFRYHVLSNTR